MIEKNLENIHEYDKDIAFNIIFEVLSQKIFCFCMEITKNREKSLDIVQEVFIKVYNNEKVFKADFNIKSWVYKVAKNECMSFYRKIGSFFRFFNSYKYNYFIQDIDVNQYEKKYEQIIQKLEQLPEKYREILFLRFYENMDYKDISIILDIKEGTVKSRLNKAKELFRGIYERID